MPVPLVLYWDCAVLPKDTSFDDGGKQGQVGGYGVGCKVGIVAVAHTGVIFTLGTTFIGGQHIRTVSIGLLSNEPFEMRQEDYIAQHVTFRADNGNTIPGISDHVSKKALMSKLAGLEPTLNDRWLARWKAEKEKQKGTTFPSFLPSFHSIPFLSFPFHSIPFHSIPFHSFPFYSIPFLSIPFHSILFHSFPFLFNCFTFSPSCTFTSWCGGIPPICLPHTFKGGTRPGKSHTSHTCYGLASNNSLRL
jgi:hypothetical protein